jgi:hypothetical protein
MPFKQYIRTEFPTHEGIVSQRAETRARKAYFQCLGEEWVEDYLPLHFLPGNEARYRIQPRDEKYLEKKRQQAERAEHAHSNSVMSGVPSRVRMVLFGGQVPLVFSGDMSQDVQENVVIKAFPTRCTIEMGSGELPYLGARASDYEGHHWNNKTVIGMPDEIQQVTPEEAYDLTERASKVYFAKISEAEGRYVYQSG